MSVRSRVYRDGVVVGSDLPLGQLSELMAEPNQLVWMDLCVHGENQAEMFDQLATELGFDRHSIEDAIAPAERAKAVRHGAYTFLTVYATSLGVADEQYRSRVRLSRISAFVLRNALVTVRLDDRFPLELMLASWDDDPELIRRGGVGALLHGLLDVVVDGHFATIQSLDDALEDLEDNLFDDGPKRAGVQRETYQLRKDLVTMRRATLPMREVVNTLTRPGLHNQAVDQALAGSFDDLYDHVLRAGEWTENLRDMITSVFETNLSLQDARLNVVMKKLAGWGAIIAVPTAVTGWFGQNIPYPGFSTGFGLWQSTLLILVGTVGLYILFKRRDWV